MLVAFYLVSATPSTTICLNSAIFLAYTCAKLKVLARFIPRQRTRCSTLLYKRTLNQPIIPAIECRRLDPEHLQRSPSRQMRLFDEADDLKLRRCGESHGWSPPSPIMLFLSSRNSSACSATTSFKSCASRLSCLTSSVVAARAVSPASRRLPASRNSFDQE